MRKALDELLRELKKEEYTNLPQKLAGFERAISLATQLDCQSALAAGYYGKATVLWKLAQPVKAHSFFEKSLRIQTSESNHYGIAQCHCGMGIIASINEEFAPALEHFEHAIAASRQAGKEKFTHVLISNVGNVYFNLGRYKDALACFHRVEAYYKRTQEKKRLAHVYNGMAGVWVYQNEFAQGLVYLHKSLALHKEANNVYGIGTTLSNIGRALQKSGELERAEQQLLKALSYTKQNQLLTLRYDVHKHLSALYADLGEAEKSKHHLSVYMEGEQEVKKEMLRKRNEQFRRFES